MGIAHYDEAPAHEHELGHIRGRWTMLGYAAGTVNVGVQRIQVPAGGWSTPAHEHAGTGVAHVFRAGEAGLTYLAYGTRDPADICFYPRSSKIAIRGLGLVARLERLDYWDGED
jgi:uncharacterized cupin superfamily protein